LFLAFQVVANLLFKWGGLAPRNYWWGFVLGNAVGMTSILFMIGMYKALPAAAVVALAAGGTFLLNQIAMKLVYREPLHLAAVVGMALIFAGMMMTTLLNRPLGRSGAQTAEMTEKDGHGK
jgi:multidrug transporter EmrE-like cation transporter